LVGEIVRTIEPHTEADPVALLIQMLGAFGNVIGRLAHWRIGGVSHYGNIFAVLVGKSGRSRKGTSWGEISRLFRAGFPSWVEDCNESGLSSGEGLIWAVRDPIYRTDPKTGERRQDDPGIDDKRLFILEAEFAQVLKQCERSGNTLSPTLRLAWETGDLRTLTKNSRTQAKGAHVSIVGHITREELLRYLTTTESANGFANRFLWLLVKRSKLLPDGGQVQESDLVPLLDRLHKAVEFGSQQKEPICRDEAAGELWREVYPQLTAEREGLAAAICGRGEAQATRIGMLYALLDCSLVIRLEHLKAGLALWRYCEQSAECIFGSALGDPTADELGQLLQQEPGGLTRTQINNHFQRHKTSDEIERALGVLHRADLLVVEKVETGGRPAEKWYWHQYALKRTER